MRLRHSRAYILALALPYLSIFGCTHQSGYNPTYIPDENPQFISDSAALLFIPEDQAILEYNKPPTNFLGSVAKFSIPLGVILRETSAEALRDSFAEGVTFTSDPAVASRCCVTIAPSITRLDYKHSGPTGMMSRDILVELDLRVEILDKSGISVFSDTYESGVVKEIVYASRTTFHTQEAADQFSAIVHRTIYELLTTALRDRHAEI